MNRMANKDSTGQQSEEQAQMEIDICDMSADLRTSEQVEIIGFEGPRTDIKIHETVMHERIH